MRASTSLVSAILLTVLLAVQSVLAGAPLPKILFFANPMQSDNDVVRRPNPETLSIAEKHFAELSQGVFEVTITQDGKTIVPEKLKEFHGVVFFTAIHPPGVDLEGLLDWVSKGGAFIGIHSTANTFQKVPAFGQMLGARFDRRPWRTSDAPQTRVRVLVANPNHPGTQHFPRSFEITDDIYQFKDFDLSKVNLLLKLDPASLDLQNSKVNRNDQIFPIAWTNSYGEGKVFYTALGDWEEVWKDPQYRTHLIEGIRWALGK